MNEIIEKCLNQLYRILSYYHFNSGEEYQKKLIPFTQIFDLKNDNPYNLTTEEANIIRIYIGLYNEGTPQNIEYIANLCCKSKYGVFKLIVTIIGKICSYPNLIEERNYLIRQGIENQNIKEKILDMDIEILEISEQLTQELKNINIKTIRDLTNINLKEIKNLTKKYQCNIFPINIIENIHDIGLTFNEEIENEITKFNYEIEQNLQKIKKQIMYTKYIDKNDKKMIY